MHVILILVVLGEQPAQVDESYAAAYKQAQEKNQPLVILVSAEWCPGCQLVKQHRWLIPWMRQRGAYTYVDYDREPELAGRLHVDRLPQLIIFPQLHGARAERYVGYDQIHGYVYGSQPTTQTVRR